MDSDDADHGIQTEDQFWDALDETISQECATHSHIDDALRSYLGLVAGSKEQFDDAEQVLPRCAYKLAYSPLFVRHSDYIRRQFIHSLLQEDDADILLITSSFLLTDAQHTEITFEILKNEGAFPRLVDLIASPHLNDEEALHRLLMQLFYEMSRIQRISNDDLACVTDEFVQCLFDLIEHVAGNVNDPYHYPVIRVLLVLNEQFMVAAHDPEAIQRPIPLTNKVVKVLSAQGSRYKTFGENIILLLNREDETSLQLLTLKLLYLLFTTPQTYEYFYTNDLRVLVDILIRNLLDLPEEATSLRHTYLRVLYPLLEHTQLQHPPHYKREEVLKLLTVLGGGQVIDQDAHQDSHNNWSHFEDIDQTTKRLVKRCIGVSWLTDADADAGPEQTGSPVDDEASGPSSPVSPSKPQPPALPAPRKLKKRDSSKGSTLTIGQFLAPQLESARQSSLSMVEMAAQKEKPGVITPSRNASVKQSMRASTMQSHAREKHDTSEKPVRPPVPKARRSGWARAKAEKAATEPETLGQGTVAESRSASSPDKQTGEESGDVVAAVGDESKSTLTGSPDESTAPPLPTATKPQKKPPPAPKTRRWQFKRGKEVEPERSREPGKFDSKLPSIKTTGQAPVEQSPFSPVEEKTLLPTDGADDEGGSEPQRSVSQALEAVQAEAIEGIDKTLEQTTLVETPETSPTVVKVGGNQPQIEVTPPARAVLAPPGPAPPRSVPGPQVEMEQSPFLSEAEIEKHESSDSEDEWNK
ncbi:uncharacterized protein HMPREF1541_03426 [Cyphellophora europaea CBS 101466]|uniref:SPIN90/Ldb17 leucine-rich domain-containing protein n=1 Tax=Cyphellophora europaea (strain CBS 101466) TaxID=1220924 RepID=W2RYT6_CYPE1|nr:uncharacterized protein HMPREF1541_03426 [Cyphellophora europaea CBS 101466]ETN41490.1 hypothetical protein HMPREF1541_03426 [Cyphellophora europaea CBS 101466]